MSLNARDRNPLSRRSIAVSVVNCDRMIPALALTFVLVKSVLATPAVKTPLPTPKIYTVEPFRGDVFIGPGRRGV